MIEPDRRRFLQSALVGAPALFAVSSRGFAQGARRELAASHSVNTAVYATHMAAIEAGYMRDAGLELKLVTTGGGSKVRDIVAAGQVAFGLGDTTHPLQLSNRGRPARMLMATDNRCTYANVVVRADLHAQGVDTVEKLAKWRRPDGAKPIIAATAIGSGTWVYGNHILRKKGVAGDFNWIGGGETQTMIGGLRTRQFDAIMAVPAWIFELEDTGFGKLIYDVREQAEWDPVFGSDFPATAAYALDDYTQKNPDLTQAYVTAMYRGQKWLLATPTKDIVAALWRPHMGSLPEGVVTRELDYYKTVYHRTGVVSPGEFKVAEPVFFNEDTKIRDIPYEKAVDNRFLEQAARQHG